MKKQDILEFWRNVEIFDLPQFKKESYLLKEKEILPWLKTTRHTKKDYTWRYTLIFGKIEKKGIVEYINNLLKTTNSNDWEEPINGFTCLSALILDQNGCPQIDNYVLASYSKGIEALEKNIHLSSVSEALKKVQNDYPDRYNFKLIEIEGELVRQAESVSWGTIEREIEYLKANNTWLQEEIGVYLFAEEVYKTNKPNVSFLNSFYLDDLNYLSSLKDQELNACIQSYLEIKPSENKRIDLIKNKEYLFDCIDPIRMTSGRWASNVEYGLYTAQFGAVNSIFAQLRQKEGVQGVNGPPGTGKTTLLKDIIAEIIVDRAKVIADLGCENIFDKGFTKIEKESGYDCYTYNLKNSLSKNFGIVVASNNNAAVENISKELPLKESVDIHTFSDIDYFADCAKRLIDKESWGIVAAALGNMKNRGEFINNFWKSDKESGYWGFESLLFSIYKNEEFDKTHIYKDRFDKLKNTFKSLLEDFDTFKEKASSYHQQLSQYIENKEKETRLKNEQIPIDEELTSLSLKKTKLEEQESSLKKESDAIHHLLDIQSQRKPSFFFFHKLFSTKTYKRWDSSIEDYIGQLKLVDKSLDELTMGLLDNRKHIKSLTDQKDSIHREIAELDAFFIRYGKLQSTLNEEYEIDLKNLFNLDFSQKDISQIHLLNPYHSPKIAKLRSNLFITALQLHENAILVNAKQIRNNLNAYFEMLQGNATIPEDTAQHLWDTFFFVSP